MTLRRGGDDRAHGQRLRFAGEGNHQPHTQHSASRKTVERIERESLHLETQSVRARGGKSRIAYRLLPPAADYHLAYAYSCQPHSFKNELLVEGTNAGRDSGRHRVPARMGRKPRHDVAVGAGDGTPRLPGRAADLRNFGESDRALAGLAPEAEDIVDRFAPLQSNGHLQRPVYVFGVSYGATVAINAASQAPELVDGVVAMETIRRCGVGDPRLRRRCAQTGAWPQGGCFPPMRGTPSMTRASTQRSWNPAGGWISTCAIPASPHHLRDNRVCTLLLQGGEDEFFQPQALRAFSGAPRVRYLKCRANPPHFALRIDLLAEPLSRWLPQARNCPMFAVPASH